MLTVHSDPDYIREAFAAGAKGYVFKSRLAFELIPALRSALVGQHFCSPLPPPGPNPLNLQTISQSSSQALPP